MTRRWPGQSTATTSPMRARSTRRRRRHRGSRRARLACLRHRRDGPHPPPGGWDGGSPLHQGALPGRRGGADYALDKVGPAVRAIKSGAAEYLVKPVRPEALRHAVSRALTTRQLPPGECRAAAARRTGRGGTAVAHGARPGSPRLGRRRRLRPALSGLRLVGVDARPNGELRHEAADGIPGEFLAAVQSACEAQLRDPPAAPSRLPAYPTSPRRGRAGARPLGGPARLGGAAAAGTGARGSPRHGELPRPAPRAGASPRRPYRAGRGPGLPRRPHPAVQRSLPGRGAGARSSRAPTAISPSASSFSTSTTSRRSTTPTATWWAASYSSRPPGW